MQYVFSSIVSLLGLKTKRFMEVKSPKSNFVRFLFVVAVLMAGPAHAQTTIMTVGDSVTQGVRGECSYRRPLSQALLENACNVNFVGSRTTAGAGGVANDPPIPVCAPQNTNHQAISGFRADQILNNTSYNFADELNTRQPDIVVLHIGSNDIFQNKTISSTVEDVNDILDVVFAYRSDATVLLADVRPGSEVSLMPESFPSAENSDRDMLADTAELSAALATLAEERISEDNNVVLVPVREGFENDLMTIDGVHPNPVGETFVSNKMLTALYNLGICGDAPADKQPPITYISSPSSEDEQLTVSPKRMKGDQASTRFASLFKTLLTNG